MAMADSHAQSVDGKRGERQDRQSRDDMIVIEETEATEALVEDETGAEIDYQVDVTLFSDEALVQSIETVDCTLVNGTESECAEIVVKYIPDNVEPGTSHPATLDDVGGIWNWTGDDTGVYRIDGDFLLFLDNLGYTFFDEDGTVYITDLVNEGPATENTCLENSLVETAEMTALIPLTPVLAETATELGEVASVGLALDGVPIFGDAPEIQNTGHMPALDVWGGHMDPAGWYHWHSTTTDLASSFAYEGLDASCDVEQDSSAQFAYAFDGYPIYGSTDSDGETPTDLHACNGHVGPTENNPFGSYHYHAPLDFPNLPPCLVGTVAADNFRTTAENGIGSE